MKVRKVRKARKYEVRAYRGAPRDVNQIVFGISRPGYTRRNAASRPVQRSVDALAAQLQVAAQNALLTGVSRSTAWTLPLRVGTERSIGKIDRFVYLEATGKNARARVFSATFGFTRYGGDKIPGFDPIGAAAFAGQVKRG
jgi:hypothetical protein